MSRPAGLLILGFGGHARSVADIAISMGITKLSFFDKNARPGEALGSYPVSKELTPNLLLDWAVVSASGEGRVREEHHALCKRNGWPLATLIAPTATLGYGASIGLGTVIGHHAHVGPLAVLDEGCIINSGAIVEHEARIGAYTHISVNSTIAGRSTIGQHCFIGAGSTVIDGVKIEDHIILGANSCAPYDLISPGTYVGVPARPLHTKSKF